jgi:hypothetical protein
VTRPVSNAARAANTRSGRDERIPVRTSARGPVSPEG